jgi:uncharacterized protein YheU (UPF0270 family)
MMLKLCINREKMVFLKQIGGKSGNRVIFYASLSEWIDIMTVWKIAGNLLILG